jgi:hypothetical protein
MCCGAADATCTTLRLQHATESATCNCTFTAKPNQECDICLRQHDGLPTAARKASQTNGIWSVDRATTSTHACCLGTSMHAYAYAGSMCLVTGTASTTCGGTTVNAAADPEPATSTCSCRTALGGDALTPAFKQPCHTRQSKAVSTIAACLKSRPCGLANCNNYYFLLGRACRTRMYASAHVTTVAQHLARRAWAVSPSVLSLHCLGDIQLCASPGSVVPASQGALGPSRRVLPGQHEHRQ